MLSLKFILCLPGLLLQPVAPHCSVLFYVDSFTGHVFVVNHEDYWYDVKPYLQLEPKKDDQLARIWYGWDDFAQGGVNEAGLFFDGAVTPAQEIPTGYRGPQDNLGNRLLATCKSVEEAIKWLEEEKIALTNAHMMLGDRSGQAVVIEWLAGERRITPIVGEHLTMTNFLLSDTTQGNYPCPRYASIQRGLQNLSTSSEPITLKQVGNVTGQAVQVPFTDPAGRKGGTLYSTFINLSTLEFVLVYQLDNEQVTKLSLAQSFAHGRRKKIRLP